MDHHPLIGCAIPPLTRVERHFGCGIASAYAGHIDRAAATTYIKADFEAVATALTAMTGQRHSLAHLSVPVGRHNVSTYRRPERVSMTNDPDPSHLDRYCREVIPTILVKACGVTEADTARAAEDIRYRAEAAACLDRESREILASPFFEESFDHEPGDAPVWMKVITTLIIRNSWLEETHTNGPVNSGGIQAITTYGLEPLSHFLAARRRQPLPSDPSDGLFTNLPDIYPRAWTCLTALRDVLNDDGGGRIGYRIPDAPVPALPKADEIVQAPAAQHVDKPSNAFEAVVFSAIDPRFDCIALSFLQNAAENDGLLLGLSALSRISRNIDKLLRVLEFLLAHGARILITNYLLTNREVWVRRRDLIKPDSAHPISGLRQLSGLGGAHKKTVRSYLDTIKQSQA